MTELKTLKALNEDFLQKKGYEIFSPVAMKILKKEAIKWAKFGFHKNKEGKWIKWKEMFKEFFNITEEDLK